VLDVLGETTIVMALDGEIETGLRRVKLALKTTDKNDDVAFLSW
jgi:hypothetical protein